jgi:hydrogenase maturation protein HypF
MKRSAKIRLAAPKKARLKVSVCGAVQGVGFRPFIYRLATELGLAGWVNNSAQGVVVEVEGPRKHAERFLSRLEKEKPPRSLVQRIEASWLPPAHHRGFRIRESRPEGSKTALVLPDIATCSDCLQEIFDPANRRYLYPFTNCTNCGPRFSIVEAVPYDRANTSMESFTMCPECRAEYEDPCDRRFHAQPNACPKCGPHLEFWNSKGDALFGGNDALLAAAHAIRGGKVVAVKGLGGFHLMTAAHDDEAIHVLRERKHREEKPFALMFPSVAMIRQVCEVSSLEEQLLRSPEAPIVLLRRLPLHGFGLSPAIAPANPYLGIMLPSNPLHHLLTAQLGFPVVATSGNLSDEPVCTDEQGAVKRLRGIADVFLVHNRPIVRHVDDSVARVVLDRQMILRRARGYAPLPVQIQSAKPESKNILAVGAHLKNAVALSVGGQVFFSQHIGDLETESAFGAFRKATEALEKLYEAPAEIVVCDQHPDYLSTQFAVERRPSIRPLQVQHHVAHVLSCMAENELAPPVLGVAWDGTGYGTDRTLWGGEFFHVTETAVQRVAHLRPFRLPGGAQAVREPRRAAMGLLYEMFGEAVFEQRDLKPVQVFSVTELAVLKKMLKASVNAPVTSSIGRLIDVVAALVGLRQQIRFEGQAAMELEFALNATGSDEAYSWLLTHGQLLGNRHSMLVLDWNPIIEGVLSDVRRGVSVSEISAKFHNALVEAAVLVARHIGEERVALSGGCFQNCYLTERTVKRLREEGFQPLWHQRVPPNDGGIALGQIMAAMRIREHQSI